MPRSGPAACASIKSLAPLPPSANRLPLADVVLSARGRPGLSTHAAFRHRRPARCRVGLLFLSPPFTEATTRSQGLLKDIAKALRGHNDRSSSCTGYAAGAPHAVDQRRAWHRRRPWHWRRPRFRPAAWRRRETAPAAIWSQEYWAKKGDVKLNLWRKRIGAPKPGEPALPILFLVHGSSRRRARPTISTCRARSNTR